MNDASMSVKLGSPLFEQSEEVACEVALERADRLAFALALAAATLDVGDRARVVFAPGDHDLMQDVVELAVAAAVEPVPDGFVRGGWDRRRSRQTRECGFAAEAAPVRPGDERLGGADWSDPAVREP